MVEWKGGVREAGRVARHLLLLRSESLVTPLA